MSDFPPVVPSASIGFAPRSPATPPAQKVLPTEALNNAQTSTEYLKIKTQELPEPAQDERQEVRDERLTGPPPAFQASLLEVEADIDFAIKKMEAAREMAADARAVEPAGEQLRTPPPDPEKAAREANSLRADPTPYDVRPEPPVRSQ